MQTLYTLVDARGQLAICTVQPLDGGWELALRSGNGILLTEHHPAEEVAVARAERCGGADRSRLAIAAALTRNPWPSLHVGD